MIHTIRPYVRQWDWDESKKGGEAESFRVWVFDDPAKNIFNEGLVSGTDAVMDVLAANIPNGEQGFELTFADEPFEGHQLAFDWVRSDNGRDRWSSGINGNTYRERETGHEAWLCPALFSYFPQAPASIYVKAAPLKGKLKHGTGQIVVQREPKKIKMK